jgi:hypothetical protein
LSQIALAPLVEKRAEVFPSGPRGATGWPEMLMLNFEKANGVGGADGAGSWGASHRIAELRQIKIVSATPNAGAPSFGLVIVFGKRILSMVVGRFLVRARTGSSSAKIRVFTISAVGKQNVIYTTH